MKNRLSRRMFSLLLCLLMCISLCPAQVVAEGDTVQPAETGEEGATKDNNAVAGTCGDDLTWALDENGVLTVSGTGAMCEWAVGETPWFECSENIIEAVLEDGVESIASHAFDGCNNLQKVTVSASVSNIAEDAFITRASLMEIDVDPENPVYSSESGILFSTTEEGKTLILYPAGKTDETYAISDDVTMVGAQAFLGCRTLKEVVIPSGVTVIGDGAFSACESLTEISIPASVTSIGHLAFSACPNLSKVIFNGNAPAMGSQVFYNDVITVYYPAGDDTWTEDVIAQWDSNELVCMYSITWDDCACADITVQRTSSPNADAECEILEKGDTVYTGDVLKVTYTPVEGYTNFTTGEEMITVDRDITSEDIYANAEVLAYTVNWEDSECADIVVERRLSPVADAECSSLNKGDTVYYGDILQVTYTPMEGYMNHVTGEETITVDRDITSEDIFATADQVPAFTATWVVPEHGTIMVTRTESPLAGAAIGELESGATVYQDDVLSVNYEADFGYSLISQGEESLTIAGNIGPETIYAKADPNEYTYMVYYRSDNGTELGCEEVTYKFGTKNYVFAKDFEGYHTPSSKIVDWDAESKTIIFEYSVVPVSGKQLDEGVFWDYGGYGLATIKYQYGVEIGTRTSDSVDVRIWWTQTLHGGCFAYRQAFKVAFAEGDYEECEICATNQWKGHQAPMDDSVTVYSEWITVPASATQQSITYDGSCWAECTPLGGDFSGTVAIPTF